MISQLCICLAPPTDAFEDAGDGAQQMHADKVHVRVQQRSGGYQRLFPVGVIFYDSPFWAPLVWVDSSCLIGRSSPLPIPGKAHGL